MSKPFKTKESVRQNFCKKKHLFQRQRTSWWILSSVKGQLDREHGRFVKMSTEGVGKGGRRNGLSLFTVYLLRCQTDTSVEMNLSEPIGKFPQLDLVCACLKDEQVSVQRIKIGYHPVGVYVAGMDQF